MNDLTQYARLLAEIKRCIQTAQMRAVLAVNGELIRLYWQVGQLLHKRQAAEGWGAAVIPRLARDLGNELPEVKGFSERNLKLMLQFFRSYPNLFTATPEIGQPPVAQMDSALAEPNAVIGQRLVARLPWAHNVLLIQSVKDDAIRFWYAEQALRNGWSRNVLKMQIDSQLHARQGKDNILAEYALRGIDKPIGIASYELTRALPESLQSALPSIESIEAELSGLASENESDGSA